jgi:structure-specific endonuclease subunit SLX1
MYLVYILSSQNKTYVGMTNDFFKRWKQHNGILKGGAKYTHTATDWTPICIIDGFTNKSEAMQCEWAVKHMRKTKCKDSSVRRIKNLQHLINRGYWTSKSPLIKDQSLTFYSIDKLKHIYFIETKELEWF